MADIFISYKREDRQRVEPLARALEHEGFSVWWDPELPIGRSYTSSIRTALNEARTVIPVWTELSVNSEWVQEEATHGKRRGVLFPVRLDAVDPPIGFTMVETVDLFDWQEGATGHEEWSRLLEQLRARVRGPATPAVARAVSAPRLRPTPRDLIGQRAGLIAVGAIALAVVGAMMLFRGGPAGPQVAPADGTPPADPAAAVAAVSPAPARDGDAPVPAAGANASINDARPLALGVAEQGEILTTEDTRYYVVQNALKVRDLALVRLQNESTTLRPDVKIFNADRSQVAEPYDGSPGASVQHLQPLTPGQPIYLQVLAYGSVGKYRISVTPQKAYDAFEPNDTLLTPAAARVGTDIHGGVMDDRDSDFYRFAGATGTTVKVTFENLSTTLRPNLKVYDANKSQVVEKYDGTAGANLSFEADIKRAGDFYVEVAPYGTAGKYRLRVD